MVKKIINLEIEIPDEYDVFLYDEEDKEVQDEYKQNFAKGFPKWLDEKLNNLTFEDLLSESSYQELYESEWAIEDWNTLEDYGVKIKRIQ